MSGPGLRVRGHWVLTSVGARVTGQQLSHCRPTSQKSLGSCSPGPWQGTFVGHSQEQCSDFPQTWALMWFCYRNYACSVF